MEAHADRSAHVDRSGTAVAEALGRLRELGARRRPDDPLLDAFLSIYYDELPGDDVEDRKTGDIYVAAVAHLDLGRRRTPGSAVVRVLSPGEGDGWQSRHSIVLVVCDDMPFLVDTLRMRIDRRGIDVHLLVHPMLTVERDDGGVLQRVARYGAGAGRIATEGVLEAWTQLEVDRLDEAEAEQLAAELVAAVDDVRRVVGDFEAMRDRLLGLAGLHPALRWLAEGQFVFLGAVDADLAGDGTVTAVAGSALGELRDAGAADLAAVLYPTADGPEQRPAVLTRADEVTTVFRAQREHVLVVTDPAAPEVQHRFTGLLSTAAQRASVLEIPGFGDEIASELELDDPVETHSHSGRMARTTLDSLPRDVVLELSAAEVAALVREIMALQERRLVRVFEVPEPVGLWTTVLVYFPRNRFTADLPERIADHVAAAFGAERREFQSLVGTSSLARVTVSVRRPGPESSADLDALAATIDELSTSWDDRLRAALQAEVGDSEGIHIYERCAGATTASYRAAVSPAQAVADLRRVCQLLDAESDLVTSLGREVDASAGEWRSRIYRRGVSMALSELLPLLDNLGIQPLDEQPFTFHIGADTVHLHDIGVRVPAGVELDERRRAALRAAFAELVAGTAESDGFNRLILLAGLDAAQVAVVRAYARYLRQTGFSFSQAYLEETLAAHPEIAALLVELFAARFDPALEGDRDERQAELSDAILVALDDVPSLDHDRICRMFLSLIEATVRTNHYCRRGTIALKFDPSRIAELPRPRPAHEIWVCSPRVEGVHLRGGAIARGGIRWSDRKEDFRTEVLGLMKAQMVKNAVIVPDGAKGGFVVKRMPATADAARSEVVACYQAFIRGLLDVTDNLVAGRVEHPADTVIHDGDDTYLVVAADKGTSTFSDIANAVAAEYGFWLGDAFASGGSAGYDHKAMGITARGAWESVRRHARVLGADADTDALTVVGIGDMSGDVFGNGMLRSPALRLLAAFDHRHVFVDPDPDPATAFAERQRLFARPRSSWADYDRSLISPGGGVYPRTAKSISLSAQARAALGGLSERPRTPDQVISAILRAPVDLLWNGGIGTYVKASAESHASVGDRSNDSVRVDGNELRCRIVAEGGNLGLTQLGRVEYALGGGLVFTDAIDNSAGVDCSDHEVNIKILLDAAVRGGELASAQRNGLLESMTEEVGDLVLSHNRTQTLALVMARRQGPPMANVHARYIDALESDGWLDRALEFLPSDKQLAERQLAGGGLTTPEFAVLIACTKNANVAEMAASDLPDDPLLVDDLVRYFPVPLRVPFRDRIEAHPLRRQIVTTAVVNQMVNLSGISFDHRMTEDTGASAVDVARAWLVSREVFGFAELWAHIDGLDLLVKLETQLDLFLACRQMAERGALWVLRHRRPPLDLAATVAAFQPGIAELALTLGQVLRGRMADVVMSVEASRLAAGVPEELAERAGVWPLLHTAFDAVELAAAHGRTPTTVAAVQWQMFDRLDLMWLWDAIGTLPRSDRWQTQARSAVRDDLLATLRALTDACLERGGDVEQWIGANERAVARVAGMLTEIRRAETYDLTTLSVALRQLRNLSLTSQL